jgi:hypothetical protein
MARETNGREGDFGVSVTYGDDVEKALKTVTDSMYLQCLRKYNYYKAGTGEDAYNVSVKMLKVLYPDGVQPSQYESMLVTWEIIRKLVVVARDKKPAEGDFSVFVDIAGWAIRAIADEEVKRKRTKESYDDR